MKLRLLITNRRPLIRPPKSVEVIHSPMDFMSDPIGATYSTVPSSFPQPWWWAQYISNRTGGFTKVEIKKIKNYPLEDWHERIKKSERFNRTRS